MSDSTSNVNIAAGKGKWSANEHCMFEQGYAIHGWGEWMAIAAMVPTRTRMQVKAHAYSIIKSINKKQKNRNGRKKVKKEGSRCIPTEPLATDEPMPPAAEAVFSALLEASKSIEREMQTKQDVIEKAKRNDIRAVSDITAVQGDKQGSHDSLKEPSSSDAIKKVSDYTTINQVSDKSATPRTKVSMEPDTATDTKSITDISKWVYLKAVSNMPAEQDTSQGSEGDLHIFSNGVTVSFEREGQVDQNAFDISNRNYCHDLDVVKSSGSLLSVAPGEEVSSNTNESPSSDMEMMADEMAQIPPLLCSLKQGHSDVVDPLAQFYTTNATYCLLPSNYDVLCGPARAYFHHIGNRRFRVMIEMRVHKYEQLYLATLLPNVTVMDREARMLLFLDEVLQSLPCRFMALDSSAGTWRVLNGFYARQKIEKAFDQCLRYKLRINNLFSSELLLLESIKESATEQAGESAMERIGEPM